MSRGSGTSWRYTWRQKHGQPPPGQRLNHASIVLEINDAAASRWEHKGSFSFRSTPRFESPLKPAPIFGRPRSPPPPGLCFFDKSTERKRSVTKEGEDIHLNTLCDSHNNRKTIKRLYKAPFLALIKVIATIKWERILLIILIKTSISPAWILATPSDHVT